MKVLSTEIHPCPNRHCHVGLRSIAKSWNCCSLMPSWIAHKSATLLVRSTYCSQRLDRGLSDDRQFRKCTRCSSYTPVVGVWVKCQSSGSGNGEPMRSIEMQNGAIT